jgi:hypothetical protein
MKANHNVYESMATPQRMTCRQSEIQIILLKRLNPCEARMLVRRNLCPNLDLNSEIATQVASASASAQLCTSRARDHT